METKRAARALLRLIRVFQAVVLVASIAFFTLLWAKAYIERCVAEYNGLSFSWLTRECLDPPYPTGLLSFLGFFLGFLPVLSSKRSPLLGLVSGFLVALGGSFSLMQLQLYIAPVARSMHVEPWIYAHIATGLVLMVLSTLQLQLQSATSSQEHPSLGSYSQSP
ncbi:MAG: hypothetical protein ACP5KA_06125 [Desulfurococcaceae archaeon]